MECGSLAAAFRLHHRRKRKAGARLPHSIIYRHPSLVTSHQSPLQSLRNPKEALMTLDLLAIAAHPDDVELTCGATLLTSAAQGYKTGLLDLTAGEMGPRGTPEVRAKESAHAAKILRVGWRGTLGVPDSDVQPSRQHKLALAKIIRQLRPRTVILPYWEARHPDHYHSSTLGYEGCFLAGLNQLPLEGEPLAWTSPSNMNPAAAPFSPTARNFAPPKANASSACSWPWTNSTPAWIFSP